MGLSVRLKKEMNGFSLDVQWQMVNEITVLFGYSGSGKTMTFQMIAGLMPPDEGNIHFGGQIFYDSSRGLNVAPQGRSLGYVFQDLALFPHMTVRENILYGSEKGDKREKKQYAQTMMEIFNISSLQNKYPGYISGGQKQRVALARALMRKPKALLLDEPFSGLDYPIRIGMRKILKDIKEDFGIPIVLITHDLDEACSLADTMIVYAEGKVVQIGTPQEVLSSPSAPHIRGLLGMEQLEGREGAIKKVLSEIGRHREAQHGNGREECCSPRHKPAFSQK